MKQQFAITHWHTIWQETEKTWRMLSSQTLKHVMFLQKCKDKQFVCGHNILTEGVFVTQLSSNTGISVLQITL
jgi:hypothetical protein